MEYMTLVKASKKLVLETWEKSKDNLRKHGDK